jgi:hypothetical protein
LPKFLNCHARDPVVGGAGKSSQMWSGQRVAHLSTLKTRPALFRLDKLSIADGKDMHPDRFVDFTFVISILMAIIDNTFRQKWNWFMRALLQQVSRFIVALTFLILFPLALSSCTSIKYQEIQPLSAELKPLKYYRWETPEVTNKAGIRAVEFDTHFRAAIEADLAKKGYVKASDKAEILVDYRISVLTTPGMEDTFYSPHWTSDNRGTFTFTGWENPQGTGDMLKQGIVTLSMRAAKTSNLLWEGGVSKLLRSDESELDMTEASKIAANALAKKIPAHWLKVDTAK